MGIGGYFKADGRDSRSPSGQGTLALSVSEKPASGRTSHNDLELQPPTPKFNSRPQSISARSARSTRSNGSSMFLDEIKHEVMVNYLYQQQCANLWLSDGSGEIEGVLLRKSRGQYMACPQQLSTSPFATACAALNVQVNRPVPGPRQETTPADRASAP